MKKLETTVFWISILLFIASLTQPAFYTSASEPDGWANSIGLVLVGWSGALAGGAGIAWFANPLILVGWIYIFKRAKIAMLSGLFATAFAVSFLFFKNIMTDEAGNYSIITHREAGYWLWLASIIFFTIGAIYIYYSKKQLNKSSTEPIKL